ncbi:MAG: hypothetical protein KA175_18345 [Flavobacteriales bacterium]|nr:hypothetical protein [Flavobacteriales bacterium]MBP6699587.1 hypothetical protein [Flavobacteriales bacterium]
MRTERDRNAEIGGLICAGCLFIGMGIGWVLGNLRSGLFIGLGVGLLGMALIRFRKQNDGFKP